MEDYEAQEVEFWRKLAEEDMSRGTMLRRSAAAAFGLTILGGRARRLQRPARASRRRRLSARPSSCAQIIAGAKKEGHLNTIALPPDWANYGEMMSTFQKKYGIRSRTRTPTGARREENQAVTR